MFTKRVFLIVLSVCFSFSAFSQRGTVKPESEKLAKQLKTKYPKEEVVALESSESYTFEPYKGGKEPAVSAVEKGEEKYICLKNSLTFSNVIYFDSTSSVEKF